MTERNSNERLTQRRITRREMLKWMGVSSSALALGGLAGCVAPATQAPPPAPADTPVPPETEAEAAPETMLDFLAKAAEPFKDTELNVLAINSPQVVAFEYVVPSFEEATGIKVNVEKGGEAEVLTKLDLELTSGAGAYDVMHVFSQAMPKYAKAEWLAPLDPYLNDPQLTNAELYMFDDFFASTVKQLSGGGSLLAAPLFVATQIFYYRKDIFEENGVEKLPDTFAELVEVCEAVDGNPLKALATRGARGQTLNMWNWAAYLFGFGGEFFASYDPASDDYMKPILDQPEAIEAADYYANLIQNYCPEGTVNWGWQESSRAFKQGEVAMIQEGSPFGGPFMDPEQSKVASEDMLACFLIPGGPAGRSAPSAAHGWATPMGSKKKEAAWLLIEWATAPESWFVSTIETPYAMAPRASVWAQPAFQEKYGWDAYLDSVVGAFEAAGEWPHYLPPIPEYPDVGEEVGRFLQAVIAGERPADEALTEANEVVYKIMEEAGYYG
jgi:multiple sugar transport system substrate-binding protein